MNFFKKLPPSETKITDKAASDRKYRFRRWTLIPTITLGYSLYYVCRLAFSATKKDLIDSQRHCVLEAAHPSPLARGAFFGCRHFSKANAYLQAGGRTPIDWKL